MGFFKQIIKSGNFIPLLMGIGFLIWGGLSIRYPQISGSPWLLLPGGVLVIVAISSVFTYNFNKDKIIAALKSYPKVSLEQLSDELKIQKKDIKSLIVDLRTDGKLKASFDPESGDVIVLEVDGKAPSGATPYPVTDSTTTPSEMDDLTTSLKNIKSQGYCPYCGSRIQANDKFCVTCGAAME